MKINTGDIFIFADPDWTHPDFPEGVVVIDPLHNCAGILGLRYFGRIKKSHFDTGLVDGSSQWFYCLSRRDETILTGR